MRNARFRLALASLASVGGALAFPRVAALWFLLGSGALAFRLLAPKLADEFEDQQRARNVRRALKRRNHAT